MIQKNNVRIKQKLGFKMMVVNGFPRSSSEKRRRSTARTQRQDIQVQVLAARVAQAIRGIQVRIAQLTACPQEVNELVFRQFVGDERLALVRAFGVRAVTASAIQCLVTA